ncbi:MAG: hypothetical protein AAGA18_04575 [Verrucomicrobiota bacterium]
MEPPRWLDALERRFGGWAVPHLTKVLILFNILTFFLIGSDSTQSFVGDLLLLPEFFLAGQFWRAITFLFVVSPNASLGVGTFFFFVMMMFFWFIGGALEETWGAFKLNVYIILSVLGVIIAIFALGPAIPFLIDSQWIFNSLLIAFGTLYPRYELRLLFIPFPIYAKWISILTAGFLFMECVQIPAKTPFILGAMLGYFVVIGPAFWKDYKLRKGSQERMKRFRGEDD